MPVLGFIQFIKKKKMSAFTFNFWFCGQKTGKHNKFKVKIATFAIVNNTTEVGDHIALYYECPQNVHV